MEDGRIVQPEKLAQIIKDLCRKARPHKITTKNVVFVVGESKVLLKIIELPKLRPTEIPGALRWQIEKILSVPPEKIYFDWEEIAQKNPKITKILVAGCPREIIDSVVTTAHLAGLRILSIDSHSGSLARLVSKTPHLLYLVLDFSNPEEIAAIVAKNRVARLSTVFSPANKKNLLEQVRETMDYYVSRKEPDRHFGAIYIFAAAQPAKIKSELAPIGLPVKILHFSQFAKSIEKDNPELDAFLVNLGLYFAPLGGINLLPPAQKKAVGNFYLQQVWRKLERVFLIVLILLFLAFVGGWLGLHWQQKNLERKLQQARSVQTSTELNQVQQKVVQLNRVLAQIATLQGKGSHTAEWMEKIQSAVPTGIDLTGLEYQAKENKIVISGVASTRDDLLVFKDNLTQAEIGKVELPLKNFEEPANFECEVIIHLGK